jgi:hypothetical protein
LLLLLFWFYLSSPPCLFCLLAARSRFRRALLIVPYIPPAILPVHFHFNCRMLLRTLLLALAALVLFAAEATAAGSCADVAAPEACVERPDCGWCGFLHREVSPGQFGCMDDQSKCAEAIPWTAGHTINSDLNRCLLIEARAECLTPRADSLDVEHCGWCSGDSLEADNGCFATHGLVRLTNKASCKVLMTVSGGDTYDRHGKKLPAAPVACKGMIEQDCFVNSPRCAWAT